MKVKGKVSAKPQRIRHGTVAPLVTEEEAPPRGWIQPNGKFIETTQHWEYISKALRLHAKGKELGPDQGEKDAHVAYTRGWVSLGHGGAFNAIGHEDVFAKLAHPAVQTLRKLVTKVPRFSLRVEKQIGEIDPATGRHRDFDVTEYDLEVFIRRGRLRKA